MATIFIHPENGRLHRDDMLTEFPNETIVEPNSVEAVPDTLKAVDEPTVLFTKNDSFRHAYLNALDDGDWVATTATGYDIYEFEQFEKEGIALTHMPTVYGEAVSEHAIAMALAISRRLYEYYDLQRNDIWTKKKSGMTDFGGDVGCVVGLGHIGEATAERLKAFDMTVRGIKQTVEGYEGAADEVYTNDDLADALHDARLVILTVPLTDDTHGMIDEIALNVCADDAIIINVARGPVLDTDAVMSALNADRIRAIGLDVFNEEPLSSDSPYYGRDDVFITPHVGGWSEKLPGRVLEVFKQQYYAWTSGEPLPHRLV